MKRGKVCFLSCGTGRVPRESGTGNILSAARVSYVCFLIRRGDVRFVSWLNLVDTNQRIRRGLKIEVSCGYISVDEVYASVNDFFEFVGFGFDVSSSSTSVQKQTNPAIRFR